MVDHNDSKIELSLIMPAYKADRFIESSIRSRLIELKELGIKYELLVVIDGESKETEDVIKRISHPSVRYTHFTENRGKGFAIKHGMLTAKGKYIGFIDAGEDILPGNIKSLYEEISSGNFDMVLPSKWHPDTKLIYSGKRKVYSRMYNFFVRTILGVPVDDTQVGVKMFTSDLIQEVIPRLLVKRFAFDVEIITVAYALGFRRIKQVPVMLTQKVNDSTVTFSEGMRSIWDALAIFYRIKLRRYYQNFGKEKRVKKKDLTFNNKAKS